MRVISDKIHHVREPKKYIKLLQHKLLSKGLFHRPKEEASSASARLRRTHYINPQ
jgi:hypothetical protein